VVTVEGDVEAPPLARADAPAGRPLVTLALPRSPAISGRVLDARGAPLGGTVVEALLWVAGEDALFRTKAGPDGAFRLRGLPAGRGDVLVRALSPDPLRLCTAERSEVRVGATDVVLRLDEAAAIRGEVVDATGQGVHEWEVEATSLDDGTTAEADSGRSEGGAFAIAGLRAGRYRLVARGRSGSARSAAVEASAPADGVRLVLERAPRIVGRVEGVRGARYDAWWTTPTSKASARIAPDGAFEIPNVGPEAGTLYVGSTSTNRYALLRDVRPGGAPLEVALVEGERVSGRVEVPGDVHPGLVYVVLAGDGFELWEEMARDGTFAVLGVPPGAYDVSLSVNESRGPTLQRVRAGASGLVLPVGSAR
jgi:hypothetical protein